MNTWSVVSAYKGRLLGVFLLILSDALLALLFPLFIGYAIDDAIAKEYHGALWLGGLGLASLIIGACRRFYDSRVYAGIYRHLAAEVADDQTNNTSAKAARLGFLNEVVEFFEMSLPEIFSNSVSLVGILFILATLDAMVFGGCLLIMAAVFFVYTFSAKRTVQFNASYNEELEQQVAVLSSNQPIKTRWHLKKLMKHNVDMSDLETINFSIIWLFMMGFLVFAVINVAGNGALAYGAIFSLVLYLFQFMENMSTMPLFYQQWLRLREIIRRLKNTSRTGDQTDTFEH